MRNGSCPIFISLALACLCLVIALPSKADSQYRYLTKYSRSDIAEVIAPSLSMPPDDIKLLQYSDRLTVEDARALPGVVVAVLRTFGLSDGVAGHPDRTQIFWLEDTKKGLVLAAQGSYLLEYVQGLGLLHIKPGAYRLNDSESAIALEFEPIRSRYPNTHAHRIEILFRRQENKLVKLLEMVLYRKFQVSRDNQLHTYILTTDVAMLPTMTSGMRDIQIDKKIIDTDKPDEVFKALTKIYKFQGEDYR